MTLLSRGFYGRMGLLLLLTSSFILAKGGKILVIPQDGSHWLSMRPVVETPAEGPQGRGGGSICKPVHELKGAQNYTVRVYPTPYLDGYLAAMLKEYVDPHFVGGSVLNLIVASYQSTVELSKVFFLNCESLLHDRDLMQHLRDSEFDVVFTDPILLCGPVVAEYLSVPSIYFLRGFPCGMDFDAIQCPNPPSYIPRFFLYYSDTMTFAQCVKNMVVHLLELFYCKPIYAKFEELTYKVLKKKVTATEF